MVFFCCIHKKFPMYVGGLKQVQQKKIFVGYKGKIHISDQSSLRICNSVQTLYFQDILGAIADCQADDVYTVKRITYTVFSGYPGSHC